MQPRRLLLIATLTAEIGIVGFTGCRSGASLSRSELAPQPAPASQLPQTEPRARLQFTNQTMPGGPTNPPPASWTFGDRNDSHTGTSGCSCSSCQGPDPNPLSRPISLFGVHSHNSRSSQQESDSKTTNSAISQVSYRQEAPAGDDPALPCPPWDGNAPGAAWPAVAGCAGRRGRARFCFHLCWGRRVIPCRVPPRLQRPWTRSRRNGRSLRYARWSKTCRS